MKKVVRVKLTPTPAQAVSLAATLARCNAGANHAAQVAYDKRTTSGRTPGKYDLQKLVYGDLKAMGLSAQTAVRAIKKTVDAYATLRSNITAGNLGPRWSKKRVKAESKPIQFRSDAAQPFDDRCLTWDHTAKTISIWTVDGRIRDIAYTGRGSDLLVLAARRKGESDLMTVDGAWYLMATIDIPDVEAPTPAAWLGVDLGVVNIATTASDNGAAGATWVRWADRQPAPQERPAPS